MKYVCDVCGWIYDEEDGYPEGGIEPGTKWDDLPALRRRQGFLQRRIMLKGGGSRKLSPPFFCPPARRTQIMEFDWKTVCEI